MLLLPPSSPSFLTHTFPLLLHLIPRRATQSTKLTRLPFHSVTRLINVLGNIVLFFEYDVTKHHAPDIPPFRRLVVNPLLSGLVFWTSPMALENMWIGRGKHPRHKSFRHGMVKAWKGVKKSFGEYLFTPAGPGM